MTFRPELRRPKGPRIRPGAPRGRMTETYLRCGLCDGAEPTGDPDRLNLTRWTRTDPWGLVHTRCLAYAPPRREAHPEPHGPSRERRRRRDRPARRQGPMTTEWDGPPWLRHATGPVGAVLGLSIRHPRTVLVVLDPVPETRRVRSGSRILTFRVLGHSRTHWWALKDCRPASAPPCDPGGPESIGSILSRL